jgi:hypothetical protein
VSQLDPTVGALTEASSIMVSVPTKSTPRPPARNHRSPKRGPVCAVCSSPDRDAIDRALIAGESAPRIAAKYRRFNDDTVRRHRNSHLPERLTRAHAIAEVAQADTLLEQVRTLHRRALGILDQSERAGDLRTALGGIREARGCLELLGRLEGELPEPSIVLLRDPAWLALQATILGALEPFPEARLAVAEALTGAP